MASATPDTTTGTHAPRPFDDFVPSQRIFTGQAAALALSPDGTTVAYSSDASGQLNLWLHDLATGQARQLTHYTEYAVRTIRFSPDGRTIAFSLDRHGDEQYQIALVDAAGGEPTVITPEPPAQRWLTRFSPDGATLYYASNDRDPAVLDAVGHHLGTGDITRIEAELGLYLAPVSVSPDGRWLLLSGSTGNTKADCYLADLTDPTAAPRQLTSYDGEARNDPGPWSTDSAGFYLRTDAGREFAALGYYRLATGTVELLDSPPWNVEAVVASRDGSTLAWVVNDGGYSRLEVRRDGRPVPVPSIPPGVITEFELSHDGDVLVFVLHQATRPPEVAAVDLRATRFRYLTDTRPPALRVIEPVRPELVSYPSHDGASVPALLYRPRSDRPAPVLLSIHGGPETQERPEYRYSGLYQYLLSMGIGVLAPNVRGSTGYGLSHQVAIHRDWGGVDLGDFEYAARFLHSLDWVIADRIAVFGRSYGGFAALSCVSRLPDLWCAGVSFVGPANLVTFTQSVPPSWRPIVARWVGDPEADADFLAERSPLTYADDITAPLFVVQGARDQRVVQAESDQIVASLRARGVHVRYDVYPDEGHAFTKRENETRVWSDIAQFLVQHLTD